MFSGGLTVGQCSGGDGLNIARMGGVLPKNWMAHKELFINLFPVDSCTIHLCSVLWCSWPLVYLINTFLPFPGFEPGEFGQRAGILSTRPLTLTASWIFGIFYLPVLTFMYNKGKHIIRDRFESCYHPKSTRDKDQPRPHSPEHFTNHVWCQSQSQAQARYLTIYKCLTLASIFHAFTWMH